MGIKTTLMLDEKVFSQAKQIVEAGLAKSMSNLVELALREEIKRIKTNQIHQSILEASKDPMFLEDIQEITSDFEHIDHEKGSE